LNITYNPKGVGDVLIFPIKKADKQHVKYETFGPIVKITDEENNVLGYNFFEASKHFTIDENGKYPLNEKVLNNMKSLFKEYGLNDSLDFDLTPKFVVGYVISKTQHENADKLSVCEVDVGDTILQIVCGAPNVEKDQKVVVAKVGATMPSGLNIQPTKLRGVPSNGMICSKKELGLSQPSEEKGIYVLDSSYKVGEPFTF